MSSFHLVSVAEPGANPEDRFSRDEAQIDQRHERTCPKQLKLALIKKYLISGTPALEVSVISRKPEVHPTIFSVKVLLKIVTTQVSNLISVS